MSAIGCTDATQLVLKTPLQDKCQEAGLRGCELIAEGAVLYIDGEKEDALSKLKRGAAKNAPEQLREFASTVKMLKDIPGAGRYAGPLLEIAELLSPDEGSVGANGHPSSGKNIGRNVVSASTPAKTSVADVAREDRVTTITTTVLPSADPRSRACDLFTETTWESDQWPSRCVNLMRGPLTVSDIRTTGSCRDRLIVGAGDPTKPRWALVGQPSTTLGVYGGRFEVAEGEPLFVAQASQQIVSAKDIGCLITVSLVRRLDADAAEPSKSTLPIDLDWQRK